MKINSNDIPQADVLEDVVRTVVVVSQGAKTYQEIAEKIGKVERQGRYYRRAAEILGFIENVGNKSDLTELGKEFLETGGALSNPLLISSILRVRIFQRLIAYLEIIKDGVKKQDLINYLGKVTEDVGDSMLPRRVNTLIAWLESLSIIYEKDQKICLSSNIISKIPILKFQDIDEPLLPQSGDLSEYQIVEQRMESAKDAIIIYRDLAKSDRAENAHKHLVNLVAQKIREKGLLPKSNQLIDLASRVDGQEYIFEMKSITEENAKSQVRKGVSQLYEYRYLQNIPSAKLVLVTEVKLPEKVQWMNEYLESDRDIFLVWDGDENLYSSRNTKEELSYLW